MLRSTLLALGLLWSGIASAQGACTYGIGVAAAAAPAGRSWDMSTPGPWATGTTPVSTLRCSADGLFVSVDAVPLLRHSYRSLGGRGPLLVTTTVGSYAELDRRTHAGTLLVSNGAARGFGLGATHRIGSLDDRRGGNHPVLLELRAARLWGLNPTYMASATLHIYSWDTDRNPGRRALGGHLRHGLTTGTLTGARLEWTQLDDDRPAWNDVGLRAGMLHNRRAGMELQPTALAFWDLSVDPTSIVQVEVTSGASLRDGAVQPVVGASVQIQSLDVAAQGHVGFLVVPGSGSWLTPDLGLSIVW